MLVAMFPKNVVGVGSSVVEILHDTESTPDRCKSGAEACGIANELAKAVEIPIGDGADSPPPTGALPPLRTWFSALNRFSLNHPP